MQVPQNLGDISGWGNVSVGVMRLNALSRPTIKDMYMHLRCVSDPIRGKSVEKRVIGVKLFFFFLFLTEHL